MNVNKALPFKNGIFLKFFQFVGVHDNHMDFKKLSKLSIFLRYIL